MVLPATGRRAFSPGVHVTRTNDLDIRLKGLPQGSQLFEALLDYGVMRSMTGLAIGRPGSPGYRWIGGDTTIYHVTISRTGQSLEIGIHDVGQGAPLRETIRISPRRSVEVIPARRQ